MPSLLPFLIGLVFLFSASIKLIHGLPSYQVGGDLYAAFVHNETWRHYAFVSMEAMLGLWILSGFQRAWAIRAALLLLFSFTALLLAEFFLSGAPRVCGCFANLIASRREEAGKALMWSTARNVAMIAALAWSLWKMTPPRITDSRTPSSEPVLA